MTETDAQQDGFVSVNVRDTGAGAESALKYPTARIGHDHGVCVAEALELADRLCARRGARLTPLRRRVLELVWSSHQPHGAYAILEALDRDGERRSAPLTVYRALEFLVAHGLVHRIESLNAFVGCAIPDQAHSGQFLVCDLCGDVTEVNDERIAGAIAGRADAAGFEITRPTVEVHGHCRACRDGGATGPEIPSSGAD